MADSVLTLVGGTLNETKELILQEIQRKVMDARYPEAMMLSEIYRTLDDGVYEDFPEGIH